MGVVLVGNYRIRVPKEVSFKVKPGDPVSAIKGTLFRKDGNVITVLKNWNRTQLENGVSFTAEGGADRFEIVVTATVTDETSLTSVAEFDPTPPERNTKKTKLRKNEGLIERLWLFLPIVHKKDA